VPQCCAPCGGGAAHRAGAWPQQRARAPGTAAQVAQSLGLLIGATVMDAKMAQTVVAVVMLTMMLARPEALLGI